MRLRPAPVGLLTLQDHNARARVRAFYDRLTSDPPSVVVELLDPGVVWEVLAPDSVPFAGRWEGRAGVQRFVEALRGAIDPPRFTMDGLVEQGEALVASGALCGWVPRCGRWLVVPTEHRWWMAGGRIVRFQAWLDEEQVIRAFGAPGG